MFAAKYEKSTGFTPNRANRIGLSISSSLADKPILDAEVLLLLVFIDPNFITFLLFFRLKKKKSKEFHQKRAEFGFISNK